MEAGRPSARTSTPQRFLANAGGEEPRCGSPLRERHGCCCCVLGSWVDAAHIHQRLPEIAVHITQSLTEVGEAEGCLDKLRAAAISLDLERFVGRSAWVHDSLCSRLCLAKGCAAGDPMRLLLPNFIVWGIEVFGQSSMCCVAHRQAPTSRSTGSSMTSATACQGDTAPRDIVQEGRALWRDSRAESHFAWRGMGATLRAVSVAIPRSAGSGHFFPECRHSRRAQTPLPSRARSSPELVKTRRLRCAEFLMGHRCRLVVVGIETGGRWASGLCWFLSTDVFSSVTISQCRTKTKPSVTCHFQNRGVCRLVCGALSVLEHRATLAVS